MQALAILEPGRTAIIDVPAQAVGPGEVRVEIAYVGFCGSDLTSFRGANPLVSYPRVPGHEIAGTISELGDGVDLAIGQPVTIVPYFNCGTCHACQLGRPNACTNNQTMGVQREGAMTGNVVVPASKVLPVDALPLRDLALVEPCAVGFHAVRRAEIVPGETVLIFGCGMIGLGALMGARRAGARTIMCDLSSEKLAVARALGADVTLNPTDPGWRQALLDCVPDGPDAVIEAVGAEATFLQAIELVSSCGRVVYIGYAKAPIAYDTKTFITKELDIRGSRNALPRDFQDVIEYLRSNPEASSMVVSVCVPLARSGELLAEWDRSPGRFTKILIDLKSAASPLGQSV